MNKKFSALLNDSHKELTRSAALETLPSPPEITLSLQEYGGELALPLVSEGDEVSAFQSVAAPGGSFGVYRHSPFAGTITAVTSQHIQILSKGTSPLPEPPAPLPAPVPETLRELCYLLQHRGVTGLGGSQFPTHIKLEGGARVLIINAVECEPYLTCDHQLAISQGEAIHKIISLLQDLIKPDHCFYAIEENGFSPMLPEGVEVAYAPAVYPSGSERQLVQQVTNLTLASHEHPSHLGVVCLNLGTLFSMYQAVYENIPVTHRAMTIAGDDIAHNVWATIGSPVNWLLEQLDLTALDNLQYLKGGPFTGITIDVNTCHVDAGFNGLIIQPATRHVEQPCIRCGDCAEVCPVNLLPQQLYWYRDHPAELTNQNLEACLMCGACDQVCPSHLPLVNTFRSLRDQMRTARHQQQKAELAEFRFELKQQRLAKKAEEKAARHSRRKDGAARNALIQGALNRKQDHP